MEGTAWKAGNQRVNQLLPKWKEQSYITQTMLKQESHVTYRTEGLTKYYESLVAVDHLTFKVKEGEVFGLLGPNVAGKTTTIHAQKLNQQ
jgi:ABC-type uncharacterized transport system ATPase subunit